jgi:hypothetical protein
MGVSGGIAAGLGSIGSGLFGLFGNSNANAPQQFQTPNLSGAANNAYSGIGSLSGYDTYAPNIGTVQGITSGLVNNPYASQYQQGAGTASQLGQLQALGQYGAGQNLQGGANAVLNTAFDPQSALYNQTLQNVTAQQNAQNAAAGVGTTPYGAGLQDQNLQNFNIAWQQQQLANQISGLGAASSASQAGQGLAAAAPGQYLNASQLPYSTYGAVGSGQIGALNTLGQFGQSAAALPQQQIADYQAYLGGGTAQQNANTNTANAAFGQQQTNLSNIFGGLGGLGSAYGLSGMGGYGSAYSPYGSSAYYGGGNIYSGDAYGGSAVNPLAGLTAADYG